MPANKRDHCGNGIGNWVGNQHVLSAVPNGFPELCCVVTVFAFGDGGVLGFAHVCACSVNGLP